MADLDLTTLYLTDWPRHGTFPSLPADAILTPCGLCAACPQALTAGHETWTKWWPGTWPGLEHRLRLGTLKLMQWLVWHSGARHGLIGWDPGFLVPGVASDNYADGIGWTLVGCTSSTLTLQAPEGVDPARLVMWAGTSPEPELGIGKVLGKRGLGVVEPNDVVQFSVPSVLALRSRPTVVRTTAYDAEARTITVEVDRDVTHAMATVGGVAGPVTVLTWREAGDRARWLEGPHVEPQQPGESPARCRWARRDYSGSLQAYGCQGVVVDGDGQTWFCAVNPSETAVQVDTDDDGTVDEWQYSEVAPSGVATFPEHGRCAQTGCSHYEPVGGAAWKARDDVGQVLQQVLGGIDTKLRIPFGAESPAQYSLSRVDTPGALTLLGLGVSLTLPPEFLEDINQYLRVGGHGEMVEYSDETGDHVRVTTGHGWDIHGSCSVAVPPAAGALGTVEHHDPVEYTAARTGSADVLQHPECIGLRWAMDTAARGGRALARWSHAEPTEAPAVVPRVVVAAPAHGLRITQCGDGIAFVRLSTPVDGWGGFVQILPLLPPDKYPDELASRTVHSVAALGDGEYAITLENVTWSTTINETTYTWKAGGGPGCPAPVWMTPLMRGSTVGSPDGGAMRGDTISVTGVDLLGVPGSARRWVVLEVTPHGGSAAASFEGTVAPVVLASDYDPEALKRDVVRALDETGTLGGVTAGATLTFWRSAGYCLPVTGLAWTAYATDEWAAVESESWKSDHSTGRVWVSEAWFAARAAEELAEVCFRA